MLTRKQKLALLQSLISGTTTPEQVDALRQTQEPIHVTLNLDPDGESSQVDPTVDTTYHIELFSDGSVEAYYRHPDGTIEPATT